MPTNRKNIRYPTVALRYFNVYGSRQALSNPHTGCAAIFTSRILNNKPPYIFEDENQTRDFIHAKDIAKANINTTKTKPKYEQIRKKPGNTISTSKTTTNLHTKRRFSKSREENS